MKDLKSLKNAYSLVNTHKDCHFCHSIDKEGYKILYKNFFADDINKKTAQTLAYESNYLSAESENIFLQWLNLE
ncbi:MAG TPA: hypothetical protein DCO89_02175 [Clostridiales bacterium]|nr:hypothetical protein [Clostridiales bacterium]